MNALKILQKIIKAIVYSGFVFIVNNIFVYRIFPRIGGMPPFIGYFLTAVTAILWLLGICAIMLGETKQ